MSWSKSESGTAIEVRNRAAQWTEQQQAADEGWSASEGVRRGHRAQTDAAAAAVAALTVGLGDDKKVFVSASGHSNDDGIGNVSISIQHGAAVEASAEKAVDEAASQGDGSGSAAETEAPAGS